MAERLEKTDMQRLILEGYQPLPFSRYALLTIENGAAPKARAWLASVLSVGDRIGTANERGHVDRYQLAIAFTHAGFEAIGLRAKGFLAPFREGMITAARSSDLGDTGSSAPKEWLWGGGFHVLLMLYSTSAEQREKDWSSVDLELDWVDRARIRWMDGFIHPKKEEHFGFRDGISQPYIEGSETSRGQRQKVSAFDSVKPGEFILGYRNEANVFPTSPYIMARDYRVPEKPEEALHARITNPDRIDFGRNGTYLVLRQLRQEVERFEKYVETQVRPTDDEDPEAQRMWIKAKMVGRWPSGAPLVKAPTRDRPELRNDNDFGFHESDRYGHACPVGSHIRRSNPRDSLVDEQRGIGPEEALRRSRRHRLIRRGRLYDTTKAENPREAKAGKGVLFLCLNANIQDQFEFVQHRWVNAPDFGGLDGETDPLVGPRPDQSAMCPMTIPGANGTRRIHGLERFVEVVGGAYFFLPGIKALKCLASLGEPGQTADAPIRSSSPSISD